MKESRRVPVCVVAVIIIAALPVLAFPAMLSKSTELAGGDRYFLWFYPAYVLAAALLAYQCYGRRTAMTWIIVFLMLLTHCAMWVLATVS
ncbi:MAG: hypothetical protein K2L73_01310 [Muribaculaceae bacterium]|nr:hypothetical protein [Muribaculaceae bacterium]